MEEELHRLAWLRSAAAASEGSGGVVQLCSWRFINGRGRQDGGAGDGGRWDIIAIERIVNRVCYIFFSGNGEPFFFDLAVADP
jgi:hypothetical protein